MTWQQKEQTIHICHATTRPPLQNPPAQQFELLKGDVTLNESPSHSKWYQTWSLFQQECQVWRKVKKKKNPPPKKTPKQSINIWAYKKKQKTKQKNTTKDPLISFHEITKGISPLNNTCATQTNYELQLAWMYQLHAKFYLDQLWMSQKNDCRSFGFLVTLCLISVVMA